ncbi:MAG: 1-acyl-sn-glycerol-3-phosphate acyltransferase [Puniceicoccales bacterium]|jgi:1-acyl-sn-glycerol-3-phosphate acyltransferase|nr:1-acyl-sn-glycerol-3-phosphate acyltransferase [Puniceicoccales bacterium]
MGDTLFPPAIFAIGRWFCRIVLEDFFDFEAFGEEYVPQDGPCIIAANHCSFLDPPAAVIGAIRNTYSFARKTLFKEGISGRIFKNLLTIPVDRDGGNDVNAIRQVLKKLADGQSVLLFPEGKRSVDGNIEKPMRGVGMIATRAEVPVVPARIFGSFDAWSRHRVRPTPFTHVRTVYGPPMAPKDYDPGSAAKDRHAVAAQRIMDAICHLQLPIS